jgi:branched-chain amino acid transport system substrate-binding protein
MKEKPDAVFVVAVGSTSAMPHLALVERGYKGKVYHTGGVANADFLRVGGKAIEGAFVPTSPVVIFEQLPDNYSIKAEALRFVKAYEAQFGSRSHFAAQMWDALNMINTVIPNALKTAKPGTPEFREAVRTAIEEVHNFKGAAAVYSFSTTKHSDVDLSSMVILRVENGGWKLEK